MTYDICNISNLPLFFNTTIFLSWGMCVCVNPQNCSTNISIFLYSYPPLLFLIQYSYRATSVVIGGIETQSITLDPDNHLFWCLRCYSLYTRIVSFFSPQSVPCLTKDLLPSDQHSSVSMMFLNMGMTGSHWNVLPVYVLWYNVYHQVALHLTSPLAS